MSSGISLAVTLPGSAVGIPLCPGVKRGGTVLQVLNLNTGADVTGSFDPYLPTDDSIFQLDTVPSHTQKHLVVFQQPNHVAAGVRFAVVNSLGGGAGTHGSVVAPGVGVGDVVDQAYIPLTDYAFGNSVDVSGYYAPTSSAAGSVTQIQGISTADAILLLIRKSGTPSTNLIVWTSDGLAASGGISTVGAPFTIAAGASLVCVLDLANVADLTSRFMPLAPGPGAIAMTAGPLVSSVVLYLFENPAA